MTVDILRITHANAAVLDRVAIDVFDEPIDLTRLAAYVAEPNHLMVVAVSDGQVIGQARGVIHRHPDLPTELYIDNLGVTPERRRERLATSLLDALAAWAVDLGCEEAWVGTEPDNEAAKALYERRGGQAEAVAMFVFEDLRRGHEP